MPSSSSCGAGGRISTSGGRASASPLDRPAGRSSITALPGWSVQPSPTSAAISSITITPARLQSLSFSQPYYDSDQSLAVAARGGPASLAAMAGKVVGVETASTGYQWVMARQAEHKFAEIRRYEGLAPALLDLLRGMPDDETVPTRRITLLVYRDIAAAHDWLVFYERFWTDRLDALERLLHEEDARKPPAPKGDDQ